MGDRRETLRRYQAIWNGEKPLEALDALVTPGFVGHIGSRDRDLSRLKEEIAAYRSAAPSVTFTIDHQFGDGEFLATRTSAHLTDEAENEVTLQGININRWEGELLAEELGGVGEPARILTTAEIRPPQGSCWDTGPTMLLWPESEGAQTSWAIRFPTESNGLGGVMTDDRELPMEEYRRAGLEITRGNPAVYKSLWSRQDDVTLANPFGPPVRGWEEVSARLDLAASNYRDGQDYEFETISTVITPELAYTVEIERVRTRVGESDGLSQIAIRATTVFRREDGKWKVTHRHGDPITTMRSAEAVLS